MEPGWPLGLLVESALVGERFMLVDVGGYCNIQIRKVADGVSVVASAKLTGGNDEGLRTRSVLAANQPGAHIFNGCLCVHCRELCLRCTSSPSSARWLDSLRGKFVFAGGEGFRNCCHGMAARMLSALSPGCS